MKFISFGKINKKFLIPLIGGIVTLLFKIPINLNPKIDNISQNPLILQIYISIGMALAFIPNIILINRSKKKNINSKELQNKSKLNIDLIVNDDIFKRTKYNKFKLIAISSIFDFLQTLSLVFFCLNCVYNLWIFDIIFINLFSYFILKTKLYKQQYISMVIIIILGLVLNVIEYFKLKDENDKINLLEISMKFFSEICLALNFVICKYNMEKNYCNPYEVCMWEGIIELILNVICLVIINQFSLTIEKIDYPKNFYDYFDEYDINDLIESLLLIFVNSIYNIFVLLTCHYFSPCHVFVIWIIKECYSYLKINEDLALNILGIITLILIAFMFLIFIEIIELNIFNISYNTKKNIENRSDDDSFAYINNENFKEEINVNEDERLNASIATSNDFD